MRPLQSTRGISKLMFVISLLVALIVGATLSYVWTMGYYASEEYKLPEESTLSIEALEFPAQDTSFFDIEVLNPSYSPSSAYITEILVVRGRGVVTKPPPFEKEEKIFEVPPENVTPTLPYTLQRGVSLTFRCNWNWANYTGETVMVLVMPEDGVGSAIEAELPLVGLFISKIEFNSTISVTRFNLTVQNLELSTTYVNITEVIVEGAAVPTEKVTPTLPYSLAPTGTVNFTCMWNWTQYQGENVNTVVKTAQGYWASLTIRLPAPVVLTLTGVFDATDTTHFNLTVQNSDASPTYVTVTEIILFIENQSIPVTEVAPPLPQMVQPNSSIPFVCTSDWSSYKNKGATATIRVRTSQGFKVAKQINVP